MLADSFRLRMKNNFRKREKPASENTGVLSFLSSRSEDSFVSPCFIALVLPGLFILPPWGMKRRCSKGEISCSQRCDVPGIPGMNCAFLIHRELYIVVHSLNI